VNGIFALFGSFNTASGDVIVWRAIIQKRFSPSVREACGRKDALDYIKGTMDEPVFQRNSSGDEKK